MSGGAARIPYDSAAPDMRLLRLAVFERLRREPNWDQLPNSPEGFDPYVDHVNPGRKSVLLFPIREVMWQLICEGVLAPGCNSNNLDFPFFHLTDLGRSVLDATGPNPFDPEGYSDALRRRIAKPDDTVLAYLAESLNAQRHGVLAASAVMLGIAAERVFLLVCESLLAALEDAKEQRELEKLLKQFPMKPKLDWVSAKLDAIRKRGLPGLPDNARLMVLAMYDLIRYQRNELGHPREIPPQLSREDVLGNQLVFVRYYETAEVVRAVFARNRE